MTPRAAGPGRRLAQRLYAELAKHGLGRPDMRDRRASLIYSAEDQQCNDHLISLATEAIRIAWATPLSVGKPGLQDSDYLNLFPGEHYRLIAALAQLDQSGTVVEIGTWSGMGTLALRAGLTGGTVHTFDIVPWDRMPVPTHFDASDFADGGIVQILADLSDPAVFATHSDLLERAGLIFMDAPKDGRCEYVMLDHLSRLSPKPGRVLVLDDIRFVNMVDFWRSIASPKLDLSAFGHWSGTGLVDLSEGLRLR